MSEQTIIIKKKKGHGGHAHHGGSWKVAYADFVTAMMAFFMVMWIMGLSDDVKTKIQGYFNDPIGFMKNQPRVKSAFTIKGSVQNKPGMVRSVEQDRSRKVEESEAYKIKSKLVQEMMQGDLKQLLKNVDITVTEEGLRIELLESTGAVFFESGRAVIRPEAMKLLQRISPILAKTGRRMVIEGHTDAKPFAGNGYSNWDLSTDRALALQHILSAGGVADRQFLSVRGYAATKLRDPGNPYHFSNRRVTILLPFESAKDSDTEMPKDQIKQGVQGMFRNPVEVAPAPSPVNVAKS